MSARVLSNLESLGEMIGALQGLQQGLNEDEYIEGLIRQAHGKASNAFNVAAAATAGAGYLTHVFEYGNPGITPGPPMFADPTAANARLWTHTLTGKGGQMDIGYTFRPALVRNPQPTTASTGVPSKYLAKLSRRKYIFWNRAYVMETGRSVEIHAKNGDFLFVPFRGASENPKNKRGYMMWNTKSLGPIVNTPGQSTKGQFTGFWMKWWAAAGNDIIEQDMRKSVTMDIERATAEAARRAQTATVKPVQATNVPGAAERARAYTKKAFSMFRRKKVVAE